MRQHGCHLDKRLRREHIRFAGELSPVIPTHFLEEIAGSFIAREPYSDSRRALLVLVNDRWLRGI